MVMAQKGFTLIEIMLVVAIIGILAAVAMPSYQRYVIKTKRVEMMTELQNIANTIESKKLALGSYNNIKIADLPLGSFPKTGTAIYTLGITPTTTIEKHQVIGSAQWQLSAEPITGTQMQGDGVLTLSADGTKCRVVGTSDKKCSNNWKD